MSEPPQDLVTAKRDFLFTAAMRRLRDLADLIQGHPWWASAGVDNAFDARMRLIAAGKANLPPGFPQELPEEMPPAPASA